MKSAVRKEEILRAAIDEAVMHGYQRVTRESVAARVGISPGTISAHFGTVACFRRSLMRAAVSHGNLKVIAQGLAVEDPHALKAPEELRRKAALSLVAA